MFLILILLAGAVLVYERKITLATTLVFYWMIFCIFGAWFYRRINMPDDGLIYIMCMVLIFYLGSRCKRRNQYKFIASSKTIDIQKGTIFLKGAVFAAIVVIIIMIQRYGYSLSSINNFLLVSSHVRHASYGGRGIFEKIAMPFIFSAFALDGYFCAYSILVENYKNKYKTVLPLLFLEIIVMGVLSTGKSLLIWSIILWISGFFCGRQDFFIMKVQKNKLLDSIKKHKRVILCVTITIAACLMIMMYVRTQRGIRLLISNMINYGFAQIPCFSMWFCSIEEGLLQNSMGKQLLFGIFDELGLSNGLASNFSLNMELYNEGVFSNIYTTFRCVIEDFGIRGSAIFWFIFGVFGTIVENKVQSKKKSIIYDGILFASYTFILFSFIISAGHYLTIILAIVFFCFELFYIKCLKRL